MTAFGSVKVVGGLLPADLIGRISAGDAQVPGTRPETYGLERGESVRRQASRSWLYLLEVWQDFKRRIDSAGDEHEAASARSARVTRERWLHILLRELDFRQVIADDGVELDGKSFPVSHRSGHVPIHLLGWATDLDHKTPHVTARAPQSMVQELLNRDDAYLWAILSNGGTLRLLRDSATLVGSSYVEFDLEAIFDGELFSDFVLLYLVCHESRFAIQGDGGPASCYLEQWRGFAAEQGERALDQLRDGVQQAISILGTGFLSHRDNPQLRIRLDPRNADLKLDDLNRALLRLVYRVLFWFAAEDRGALLQPDPEDAASETRARLREARDRYAAYFSAARLRQLARRKRGGRHGDLWEAAQLVFDALGTEGGVPELALPGIGGIFESKHDDGRALPLDEPLAGARLSNDALLGAVRALSLVKSRSGGGLRRVDFGNLGAEELGSVYESLLELVPRYDAEQLAYTLESLAGNERKETGSYYTPTSLVECLLDSALNPLLKEARARGTEAERVAALLEITVCDPACGSGHFLVAAARRIAKCVAAEETGESEPPESVIRGALRRVAGRCIYGVDINPMAAELAKVSLWIEALEPGKPLSFLDQNASREPKIANAANAAARKKLIADLVNSDSLAERTLFDEFLVELRKAAGWSHLLRESGRYRLTGHGDINTYAVFAETARTIINARGRSGLVLPTGIATDATTAPFFSDLVRNGKLVSFLEFENEAFLLSHAVDHRVRFCLLTVCGAATRVNLASFAFGTRYIKDLPVRRFAMPPEEILLVNPNTGTTPVFRSRRDAEITIGIYKRVPVLWRDDPEENPWGLSFLRMFDMANDAGLFQTRDQLERDGWTLNGNVFMRGNERMLPLYEAKMIHHFDHRLGTYQGQTEAQANMGTLPRLTPAQQDDPDFVVMPRYWVQEFDTLNKQKSKPDKPAYDLGVSSKLEAKRWEHGWLLGWRDICRSTDERTLISSVFPRTAAPDGMLLMLPSMGTPDQLLANLCSFVLDYVARQKSGGTHLKYFTVRQLPVLSPGAYHVPVSWLGQAPSADWTRQRVLELSYTAWDVEPIARDLGDEGPPFRWNEDRRTLIRAELDAAYFHLYGLERDEVEHVMDSFDALRHREEKPQNCGEFRTKRLILERYDAMADAAPTDVAYQTILDPPPGRGPRHPDRASTSNYGEDRG